MGTLAVGSWPGVPIRLDSMIQVITCDANGDAPVDTCPTKYQMPCSKHWKRTERIAIAKQARWLNCNCFPKAVVRLVQHLMMTPHAQPQK